MEIIVDADACPVKEIIITEAKKYSVPVTMVTDTSHILDFDYCNIDLRIKDIYIFIKKTVGNILL